jgi:cyclopropane fatty-acyl-phospholipid synthase-like methyltransferase
MEKDFEKIKEFWDNKFKNYINDKIDYSYLELAPSKKLVDEILNIKDKDNVLDYGAGNGWASLLLANNNKNVLAVDTSSNSIDVINKYAKHYGFNNINTKVIDSNWIYNNNLKFDAIVTSNVIDVLPENISKDILKFFYQSLNDSGILVIGMNYYIDPNEVKDIYDVKGNEIYIDNVLRMYSLSDEEWINEFNKYFNVIKLEHFMWPGEEKELRRLFILNKK